MPAEIDYSAGPGAARGVLREDLARIYASLNNRPRKTLGLMAPLEELIELLARARFWSPTVSALMDATRREATCGMPC